MPEAPWLLPPPKPSRRGDRKASSASPISRSPFFSYLSHLTNMPHQHHHLILFALSALSLTELQHFHDAITLLASLHSDLACPLSPFLICLFHVLLPLFVSTASTRSSPQSTPALMLGTPSGANATRSSHPSSSPTTSTTSGSTLHSCYS
jgi:hypothetical protein